jgi:hypothetical protein
LRGNPLSGSLDTITLPSPDWSSSVDGNSLYVEKKGNNPVETIGWGEVSN